MLKPVHEIRENLATISNAILDGVPFEGDLQVVVNEFSYFLQEQEISRLIDLKKPYEDGVLYDYVLAGRVFISLMKHASFVKFSALDGSFYIAGIDLCFRHLKNYIESIANYIERHKKDEAPLGADLLKVDRYFIYEQYLDECEYAYATYKFNWADHHLENQFPNPEIASCVFDEAMSYQNEVMDNLCDIRDYLMGRDLSEQKSKMIIKVVH